MDQINGYPMPPEAAEPAFPTGKRELRFLLAAIVIGVLMADFVFYSGFYLGFAVISAASIAAAALYLLRSGCKLTGYSGTLLALSFVICQSGALPAGRTEPAGSFRCGFPAGCAPDRPYFGCGPDGRGGKRFQ